MEFFLLSTFCDDVSKWQFHDPAVLAQTLEDGELVLYFDCGTEDGYQLQHGASYLHEVLEACGVAHDFALMPGTHSVAFWAQRIEDSLRFHMGHFAALGAQEH
ncbi:MAG: hypothetical protein GY811_07200 [Myxococcales bacterium]|nr:hypothetical protein [Myxococcales bacterium]